MKDYDWEGKYKKDRLERATKTIARDNVTFLGKASLSMFACIFLLIATFFFIGLVMHTITNEDKIPVIVFAIIAAVTFLFAILFYHDFSSTKKSSLTELGKSNSNIKLAKDLLAFKWNIKDFITLIDIKAGIDLELEGILKEYSRVQMECKKNVLHVASSRKIGRRIVHYLALFYQPILLVFLIIALISGINNISSLNIFITITEYMSYFECFLLFLAGIFFIPSAFFYRYTSKQLTKGLIQNK